jgi:hypothetical protein
VDRGTTPELTTNGEVIPGQLVYTDNNAWPQ